MSSRKERGLLWFSALMLLVLGLFLLIFRERFFFLVFRLLGFVFLIDALKVFIKFKPTIKEGSKVSKRSWSNLGEMGAKVVLGGLCVFYTQLPTLLFTSLLLLYLLVISVIQIFSAYLLKKNQDEGYGRRYFDGFLAFGFSIWLLFNLSSKLRVVAFLMGCYIVTLGLANLRDATFFLESGPKGKRLKRIAVPVIFSALVPEALLNRFNKYLNKKRSSEVAIGAQQEGHTVDLEVWIHTARKGFEKYGHMDISYQGMTYSYGLYDSDRTHLFGTLGDGVLWTIPSDQYQASLAEDEWRAVFKYGLDLTAEQKASVAQNIERLMTMVKPFDFTTESQKESYLGQVAQRYEVKAYKFKRSKFKTYFVLSTNCVLLADYIIGDTGLDIIGTTGIMTPGAYQLYFEQAYLQPNSNVVARSLQSKKV